MLGPYTIIKVWTFNYLFIYTLTFLFVSVTILYVFLNYVYYVKITTYRHVPFILVGPEVVYNSERSFRFRPNRKGTHVSNCTSKSLRLSRYRHEVFPLGQKNQEGILSPLWFDKDT